MQEQLLLYGVDCLFATVFQQVASRLTALVTVAFTRELLVTPYKGITGRYFELLAMQYHIYNAIPYLLCNTIFAMQYRV